MNENALPILMMLLPIVAFFYASVGHGGASSYIMLLSLMHFTPLEIRPTALLINIVVSFIAFISYNKVCRFPVKTFFFLMLLSVPASFIGAGILVDPGVYRKITGVLLLFPVLRFTNLIRVSGYAIITPKIWMLLLLGLSIGFVSGIIGIGGGIILSPILLMLGWADIKETAALSALFIFFNSVAGYLGTYSFQIYMDSKLVMLIPLTIAGGIAGAHMGAKRFNVRVVKYILTMVLFTASIKLIIG